MNYKWKRILTLCIAMLLFIGSFGSMVYAGNGNGNGDITRDKDCKEIFIDCEQDRIQQHLRDCDYICDLDQERLHLWLKDRKIDNDCINELLRDRSKLQAYWNDLVEAIEEYKNLEKRLEVAKENKDREKVNELTPKLEKAKLRVEEMLKLMKVDREDINNRLREQNRFMHSHKNLNQLRIRLNIIEQIIEYLDLD